jgi:DNA-binding transcriptional LysR family regulator
MAWCHPFMDISWEDVRLFLAVAEAGSVSGAARALRLGQPTVTRRLAVLEDTLGEKLFRRSVAGTALTVAGERLLPPARRMAEWAGEVGRAAASRDRAVRGLVRVTAIPLIAHDLVAPFAQTLKARHPELRLELLSSMSYLDLARGEADIALRTRAPTQADLTEVRAFEVPSAVFVAPALRARLPRRPKLTDLPWIGWAPPHEALPPNPQLAQLGVTPVFTSDHILLNLAAAEAGLGAIALPQLRHRYSRPTTLVPLPIDLGPFRTSTLHVVCARSALEIPRVRTVVDLLVAELQHAVG